MGNLLDLMLNVEDSQSKPGIHNIWPAEAYYLARKDQIFVP